jgi:hypothetical protein
MQQNASEIDEMALLQAMAKWHPSGKKLDRMTLI